MHLTAAELRDYRQCQAEHADIEAQLDARECAMERGDITIEEYRNWQFDYGPE